MIPISNHIEIARPVGRVFEYVADVRNNPQWMPVQQVHAISGGEIHAGTTFKQKFSLSGTVYELDGKITAYEPNTTIAFLYEAPVFTWRGNYHFEPTTGGTRLSARGHITLSGKLRMMESMFAPKIRKLINDTAPNLKNIL